MTIGMTPGKDGPQLEEQSIEPRDWFVAAGLFLVALATRIPFRSRFAYHWDSAQFALAVSDYNLRIGQPHAPGFYLYVWLGRLMNRIVGEPHQALVWLSVIAGAWLVAVGFVLATSMFGRGCGVGTGLILLTSPLCWFHSEIALTTIVDSALVATYVFVCWRAVCDAMTWRRCLTLAALFAAVAGVRLQSSPIIVPLSVYVFHSCARSGWTKRLVAVVAAAGLSLCWFVPMVKSAGGLASYVELLRLKSQFDAGKTVWGGGGARAMLENASVIAHACWSGLLAAGFVAAVALVLWVFGEDRGDKQVLYGRYKAQIVVLTLWIVPAVLFWAFMYVTMPGYVLNFFPALGILASLGLIGTGKWLGALKMGGRSWGCCSIWAGVLTVNATAFLFSPAWMSNLWFGLPLSRVEIREHDTELVGCFRTIRQKWPSHDVVVCHHWEDFYCGFRQFEYYLPEYQNLLLTPDSSLPGILGAQKWVGCERRTTFSNELVIAQGRDILIVVPPGVSVEFFRAYFKFRNAALVWDRRVKLYRLEQ